MVLDYFGLREHPFGVTPDSKYLYLGDTHREALASLIYGIEAGCGFVAVIAAPGLGKTTLLYHAMSQLRDEAKTVFLFQTLCTPMDLLRALLNGLGIREFRGTLTEMQWKVKEVLQEEFRLGKRVVVVIDEAQNLDDSVLELVRMLSNFETSREKLIQIVLSGQPHLAEKIGSPELVQLRQRLSIIARLKPFTAKETTLYIEHRLRMAGYSFQAPLFTKDALALIAEYSEGVPRTINNVCFNSLALACALRQKPIDAGVIREVVGDLSLDRFRKPALAAPQPEKSSAGMRGLLAAAATSPWFAGSMGKLAVSAALLLALGGTLLARHPARHSLLAAPAEGQAKSAAPAIPMAPVSAPIQKEIPAAPVAVAQSPSMPSPSAPQEDSATDMVRVTPGKTLLRICVDHFGKCGPQILQQIRRLNPRLSDFDHIEAGQSLRFPAAPRVSRASATEPVPKGNGAASE